MSKFQFFRETAQYPQVSTSPPPAKSRLASHDFRAMSALKIFGFEKIVPKCVRRENKKLAYSLSFLSEMR